MTAWVVEYSSRSPERSCSKSISSVNACQKLLFAVTTHILVVLREIHVSSIVVSFGSLNVVIFAMSSQFACGQTLLYFVRNWSHFSFTVANSRMRSPSKGSMHIDIV